MRRIHGAAGDEPCCLVVVVVVVAAAAAAAAVVGNNGADDMSAGASADGALGCCTWKCPASDLQYILVDLLTVGDGRKGKYGQSHCWSLQLMGHWNSNLDVPFWHCTRFGSHY